MKTPQLIDNAIAEKNNVANNFGFLKAVLNSFHCLRIAMIMSAKGTDQAIRWDNISTGLASCVSLK